MPVSGMDQLEIQKMVENASKEERLDMFRECENSLSHARLLMGQKKLSKEENYHTDSSIEIILRIEALEKGKGWWFRTKRRPQLILKYLS